MHKHTHTHTNINVNVNEKRQAEPEPGNNERPGLLADICCAIKVQRAGGSNSNNNNTIDNNNSNCDGGKEQSAAGCYFEVLVLIIHDNPSMKMNTKTQQQHNKEVLQAMTIEYPTIA
ncbi:uncharacterized protein LOC132788139 [Drosophila nasuta]|uniref:uncharacterized protein LOC132788139 n=1 Tax=Drosophila nasuta TaxID=42062 RepID=UPI00295F0FF5|nr:uncharacterized protein LOC132788139 [Drosophila nasuta]